MGYILGYLIGTFFHLSYLICPIQTCSNWEMSA